MTVEIRSGYATHVGNVREHNEDKYLANSELGLWIVADGMGGHECGEIASEITIEQICQSVEGGKSLKESLESAHDAVINASDEDPTKLGMGSTVVVLKITEDRYEIAWVGDSRIYMFRQKKGFNLLTHDHSYVQLLVNNDLIAPEDAKGHPMSHVVNQAIGSSPGGGVDVDTAEGLVEPGDRFLLCTDGLTNELSDERIQDILRNNEDQQTAVDNLIQQTLEAGGTDNVTLVVVDALA